MVKTIIPNREREMIFESYLKSRARGSFLNVSNQRVEVFLFLSLLVEKGEEWILLELGLLPLLNLVGFSGSLDKIKKY